LLHLVPLQYGGSALFLKASALVFCSTRELSYVMATMIKIVPRWISYSLVAFRSINSRIQHVQWRNVTDLF
jgi:hypothetical protein